VLQAIGSDPRIGPAYFNAGSPPGGPCFPRDNRAMSAAMSKAGLRAYVADAVAEFEQYQIMYIARRAVRFADIETTIGILGIAYKPNVDLSVGSQSMLLARAISIMRPDLHLMAYDPCVAPTEEYVEYAATLEELVEKSDTLVLMTCWPDFVRLEKMDLTGKYVFDLWGFLDREKLHGCEYVRFGEGK